MSKKSDAEEKFIDRALTLSRRSRKESHRKRILVLNPKPFKKMSIMERKSKIKLFQYATVAAAFVGTGGILKNCAETAQDERHQKISALLAQNSEQQLAAIRLGEAFTQCKEKLTGHHFNAIPVDTKALSTMLQPQNDCTLYLGKTVHPDLPLWNVATDPNGQLQYLAPK